MNDVDELKEFVIVHTRAQNLDPGRCRALLRRIDNDHDGATGSWAAEWSRDAADLERTGDLLEACRYYNMARFPYVDGAARGAALDNCVRTFDRWRQDHPDIQRLDVELDGGRVRCWTSGLSQAGPRPLLLFMGGIVTIKEQWAPVLVQARRLGMAMVVTEMPGVGENTLSYDENSPRMLGAVLDALADRADVGHTYAVALSFSGHLALRHALDDRRIRGIVTSGAPVSDFFTDTIWRRALPRVTVDTLGHLAGIKGEEALARMTGWALTDSELASLDIPVAYLASRRDEIIPPGETVRLRRQLRHLDILENDDVHGSPHYAAEARLWTILSVLRMRRVRNLQRVALATLLRLRRARRRPAGAGA
ncbi:alpha/beta hydrolase [Streptomyces sp. AK02-01A]|uniref:alpha/beta hydrolase n=1 Tax=Streptomyces sp. AK02-01A TaxID=3028648 RepID=UPI0029ACCD1C|nr:alpha/beta hydrolase [Streptomyces sp. AK02-01A]MDX3854943.1 alpha/beta hydrolase [Streptomyces sp. AK02-01A]